MGEDSFGQHSPRLFVTEIHLRACSTFAGVPQQPVRILPEAIQNWAFHPQTGMTVYMYEVGSTGFLEEVVERMNIGFLGTHPETHDADFCDGDFAVGYHQALSDRLFTGS
jgi:hypothetical protein